MKSPQTAGVTLGGRPWLKEFTHLHFTSFSSSILGEILQPP